MKILTSFENTTEELIQATGWYHTQANERFSVSPLQAYATVVVGSLLYSLRSMDVELLKEAIGCHIHRSIHIRWMKMADGKAWKSGRNTKDDPAALHVECAVEDQVAVEKYFRTQYSSTSKKFPLHIRMRFIPQLSRLMGIESAAKHQLMRNRQQGWCAQSQALTTDIIGAIDLPIPNHGTLTVRDVIMKLSTKEDASIPLIFSIDAPWRGSGLNFSYHPK